MLAVADTLLVDYLNHLFGLNAFDVLVLGKLGVKGLHKVDLLSHLDEAGLNVLCNFLSEAFLHDYFAFNLLFYLLDGLVLDALEVLKVLIVNRQDTFVLLFLDAKRGTQLSDMERLLLKSCKDGICFCN